MVIQRIQTLWLLIATVLMCIIGLRPFSWVGDTPVYLSQFPVLAVINWLIAVLLFIAIFTFKNLKLQKTIVLVALVLMTVLGIVGFIYQQRLLPEALPEWGGGVLFLIIAAVLDYMAYRGICNDRKKLRNSDRLWS